jgi:hypothetical protein
MVLALDDDDGAPWEVHSDALSDVNNWFLVHQG